MSSLLIDSLGISGQTLVAVSLGQGDRKTARKVTDRLLQLGIALGIGLSAILALLGPAWPQLFTQVSILGVFMGGGCGQGGGAAGGGSSG